MSQAAERIRQAATREPKEKLTALLHHITTEELSAAYFLLRKEEASGVDSVTRHEYGDDPAGRLLDLHNRVHSGAYRALPSRRVEIPKSDGGTRPLGIAALEDKIVQKAVAETILLPIFEPEFLGFQHKRDAERFLCELKDQLASFSLELYPDKTRLIEFCRFADAGRRARSERRPETFDFLGFTHYWLTGRSESFVLGRKPIGKRVDRTLKRIKAELRRRMHRNPYEVAEWLGRVLDGWVRYYAVPNSYPSLQRFANRLRMMWLRVLQRRSHMDRTRLDKLGKYAAASWPPLKILHPWSKKRFSRHITEVGAPCVSAHAGICTGGAGQPAFLP